MFWICFVLAVALDRVTKYAIASNMHEWQSIPVIDGIFHITYVMNDGAAWSILQGQRWFFVIITVAVFAGVLWFLHGVPKNQRLMRFSLALFSGGACGNFLDRLFLGKVTDFLDFRVFPVFNVADCCIVVGVALLGLCVLKGDSAKIIDMEVEEIAVAEEENSGEENSEAENLQEGYLEEEVLGEEYLDEGNLEEAMAETDLSNIP